MSLDDRFGAAKAPRTGTRFGEDLHYPQSLVTIDLPIANIDLPPLVAYMIAVQRRCGITSYLCDSVTILWLIDADGRIRLAVEEAFDAVKPRATIPILRHNRDGSSGWHKLGHPSLLDEQGKLGRIGGEMRFFPNLGRWELNNDSGRYGMSCGRTAEQLKNVANCLKQYGVSVQDEFLG